MTYELEYNVPLAPIRRVAEGPDRRLLAEMPVGASFLLPDRKARAAMAASITRVKRTHPGRDYAVRQVDGGYRVWRVA